MSNQKSSGPSPVSNIEKSMSQQTSTEVNKNTVNQGISSPLKKQLPTEPSTIN